MPVLIDDEMTKNSYCIRQKKETENCTEATYKISNGKGIYSCTKCMKENTLIYNQELDVYYCAYNDAGKCLVKYCKTCASNNAYFCSSCITSEYEVNQYSGSCIKKTEIEPFITWKDIYRLNMNGHKIINGRIIKGPSLKLRGITTSQINSRHAFLVYLTFKLKNSLRYLEENLKIPVICEIDDDVEEENDDVNNVDYECIGNTTISEKYELTGIEGNNLNDNIINNSNKNISDYKYENRPLLFILKKNDLRYKIFHNNLINFSLNGTLNKLRIAPNKEITNQKNIPFEFNEIDKKAMCDFTRDEKLNADFSCNLEIGNETSFYNLTFKNNEIRIGEVDLYINSLNKINFSYEKEEEANIREYHPKAKNDNHTTIIVVCIVAGVVVICGVIFLLLYIFIWKKRNNNGSNAQNVDSTMYNVG